MQSLYIAPVNSNENAIEFLRNEPWKIGPKIAHGTDLARRCFVSAARWLSICEDYSISNDVFEDHFLRPARAPAKFISSIRNLGNHTTGMDAFVFARSSEFYDRYHGENVATVSMVVPELGSALSLRCRRDLASNIHPGNYRLEGVQPVPFVNRIHPTARLSVVETGTDTDLSSIDSLKVSVEDVGNLSSLLAFENISEIESTQLEGKRTLGFACIFGGRFASFDHPLMTLESAANPALAIQVALSSHGFDQFHRDRAKIVSMINKPIRVLGVVWYNVRTGNTYPEVYWVEEAAHLAELTRDDAIGFVRLRGALDLEEYDSRYKSLHGIPQHLQTEGDIIRWISDTPSSHNPVVRQFLEETAQISTARLSNAKVSGIIETTPQNLLGDAKLTTGYLAFRISRDGSLYDSTMALLKYLDKEGQLPSSPRQLLQNLTRYHPRISLATLILMRYLGILSFSKEGISVTTAGLDAAYLATQSNIISNLLGHLENKKILNLVQLEPVSSFPVSLLIQGLEELEEDDLASVVTLNSRKLRLVWIANQLDSIYAPNWDQSKEFFQKLSTSILIAMRTVAYPLGTLRILQMLKEQGFLLTHLILSIFLAYLSESGKIQNLGKEMWRYRYEDRIRDVLFSTPEQAFAVSNLLEMAGLPPSESENVVSMLKRLQVEGSVSEPFPGYYGQAPNNRIQERERITRMLKSQARAFIISELTRGTMSVSTLIQRTLYQIFSQASRASIHVDPLSIPQSVLDELIRDGAVVTQGTNAKLGVRK